MKIGRGIYGDSFEFDPYGLVRHCLLTGSTGFGKTNLLALMLIALFLKGIRWALIDPKGDTAALVMGWLARLGADPKDIIHLSNGFSVDPLYVPPELTGREFETFLERRIISVEGVITRGLEKQIDSRNMPRRTRRMQDAMWFNGVRRGNKPPLGFCNVLKTLLYLGSPGWIEKFEEVSQYMPEVSVAEWNKLLHVSANLQEQWLDSTISAFRRILRPTTMPMFEGRTPPLLFDDIVKSKTVVCDFGYEALANEIGLLLSNVIFSNLLESALRTKCGGELFIVAIEEADLVLGPDIVDAMNRSRSANMGLIICTQTLEGFEEN